jgi:hypothetical protein
VPSAAWVDQWTYAELLDVSFAPPDTWESDGHRDRLVYARARIKYTYDLRQNRQYMRDLGYEDSEPSTIYSEEIYTNTIYFGDRYSNGRGGVLYTSYAEYVKDTRVYHYTKAEVYKFFLDSDLEANLAEEEDPISDITVTPRRAILSGYVGERADSFGNRIGIYRTNISYHVRVETQEIVHHSYCEDGVVNTKPSRRRNKRIPPPRPMKCCPDNSTLLKQILKIVKENKKAIGVDEYPATVPKSFINKNGKEAGVKQLSNLTQLVGWYVERFDEVVGQFEIPIDVDDIDLTKKGNQSVKIRLPNIAESIAEMFLMILNITINNEVQTNIATRILAETGADKQQNFKSYMMLEAITEYLGFSYREQDKGMPLTFSPGKESFDEMLVEKEVRVSCVEYDDKVNLPKQMQELLNAAAIVRGALWKQLDPKKDLKKQLLDSLIASSALLNRGDTESSLAEIEKEINLIQIEENK